MMIFLDEDMEFPAYDVMERLCVMSPLWLWAE